MPVQPPASPSDQAAWTPFVRGFVLASGAALCILYLFALILDPYGIRVGAGRGPTPMMDINQRWLYPQLARSGIYDAAIVGTSTVRLLDPVRVGEVFGVRTVNLGLNAGTPWEQMQLAELFLRHAARPRLLLVGLDERWCAPDADSDIKRTVFPDYPGWLYDESQLNDYPQLLSLKAVEIAGRVALRSLGLMRERVRSDGYEVFTPPEARYDLTRARVHIWAGTPGRVEPADPPFEMSAAERSRLRFPAIDWLAALLEAAPRDMKAVLLFPPSHVAAQAAPQSRDALVDAECKDRLSALALRRGGAAIDFRFASPITSEDANFWDKLHYRTPIVERIMAALRDVAGAGAADRRGEYRVRSTRDGL